MGLIDNNVCEWNLLNYRIQIRHEDFKRSDHDIELVQLGFLSDCALVSHISEVPFPVPDLFSTFSTIGVIV
jgi:hypothetical protein